MNKSSTYKDINVNHKLLSGDHLKTNYTQQYKEDEARKKVDDVTFEQVDKLKSDFDLA